MEESANKSHDFVKLRSQAEQLIQSRPKQQLANQEIDILTLVNELDVYQAELEVQNEELRSMQAQLLAANQQYMDLYDFAPVGYLTVDQKGLVSQANLAITSMLGIARAYLINSSFASQISPEDQRAYFAARNKARATDQQQTCQLEFLAAGSQRLCVQMEITADKDDGELIQYRIAVVDITQRVRAEEALRKAHDELEERVQERTEALVASNEKLKTSEQKRRLMSDKVFADQEAEKKRIAYELHDSIGQCLSAIKFQIGCTVNHLAEGCSEEAAEACKAIIPIAQQSIDDVRRMTAEMRPPMLDELGILITIQWFGRIFQNIYKNLHLETKIDAVEDHIPESLKIIIYRVMQESLDNVVKHSKADQIMLTLTGKNGTLALTVEDNGHGFNPAATLAPDSEVIGCGLETIKDRVELADGIFTVQSENGKGTIVKASWYYPTDW